MEYLPTLGTLPVDEASVPQIQRFVEQITESMDENDPVEAVSRVICDLIVQNFPASNGTSLSFGVLMSHCLSRTKHGSCRGNCFPAIRIFPGISAQSACGCPNVCAAHAVAFCASHCDNACGYHFVDHLNHNCIARFRNRMRPPHDRG